MTHLEGPELTPPEQRLLDTLEQAYRATPSPRLDTAMLSALHAPAPIAQRRGRVRAGVASRTLRSRLVSAGAMLALVAGGSAGYLRFNQPVPASAEVILRHVAAALPRGGDQVVHEIQVTTDHTKIGDPAQVQETWTQLDAAGSLEREMRRLSAGTGTLLYYSVMNGTRIDSYDAFDNRVETTTTAKPAPLGNNPYGVAEMQQLIQSAQSGTRSARSCSRRGSSMAPRSTW